MRLKSWILPLGIFFITIILVFRNFFLHGLLPIPADILVGAYYPWFDYNWGYPVHVPIKNPLPSDVFSIIYPWRILGISILKSGHLPLWDPTILLGVPLLANFQSALGNPLNILFFIMDEKLAWSLQVILQPTLSLIFMFLYLKELEIKRLPAIFGSLLYSFSGFALVWLEYNSIVFTLSFVPLIFLLTRRIIKNPKLIQSALLGLILGWQLLSGYPLTTFFTLGFAAIYFGYLSWPKKNLIAMIYWLMAVATGFGLAAFQFLPGWELSNLSIRNFDVSALAGEVKYLPIAHLITFFIPDFFGNPATRNFWSIGSFDNFAFFLPATGAYLFMLSLASKVAFKKELWLLLAFGILSLVFAMSPVDKVLPGFLGLKSAVNTRILFMFCFSASILAAATLDQFENLKLSFVQKILPFLIYPAIIIATVITLKRVDILYQNLSQVPTSPYSQGYQVPMLSEIQNYHGYLMVALKNSVIPLGIASLTWIFIQFQRLRLSGILLLTIISIVISTNKYLTFMPKDLVFPNTEVTDFLANNSQGHRVLAEKAELLPANSWSLYNLKSPIGQDSLAPLNTMRLLNLINTKVPNDQQLTRYVYLTDFNSPDLNSLDIKYIVTLNRKDAVPDKNGQPLHYFFNQRFKEVKRTGTVTIFENTANLGQAWFDSGQGQILKTTDSPNQRSFWVQNTQPGNLTISQTYFPGWSAYIDDLKTEVKPTQLALTSVFVPTGNHQIKLIYQPESFTWGLIITGLTGGFWIIVAGLILLKRLL